MEENEHDINTHYVSRVQKKSKRIRDLIIFNTMYTILKMASRDNLMVRDFFLFSLLATISSRDFFLFSQLATINARDFFR